MTLTAVPESTNVSAGTLVEFTCATAESGVTLAVTTTPTVDGAVANLTDLPSGGNLFSLSFTAPSQHSSITITCIAFRSPDVVQPTALLMIQGNVIIYTCHASTYTSLHKKISESSPCRDGSMRYALTDKVQKQEVSCTQ